MKKKRYRYYKSIIWLMVAGVVLSNTAPFVLAESFASTTPSECISQELETKSSDELLDSSFEQVPLPDTGENAISESTTQEELIDKTLPEGQNESIEDENATNEGVKEGTTVAQKEVSNYATTFGAFEVDNNVGVKSEEIDVGGKINVLTLEGEGETYRVSMSSKGMTTTKDRIVVSANAILDRLQLTRQKN